MLDIKWIRENPDALGRALANRDWSPDADFIEQFPAVLQPGIEGGSNPDERRRRVVEAVVNTDKHRREQINRLESVKQRRNAASKEVAQAKAQKNEKRAQELIAEVARLKEALPEGERVERELTEQLREILARIPNVPLEGKPQDAPPVGDEGANFEVRKHGAPKWQSDNEEPRPDWIKEHFELGEALGLMDFEAAAKLSGSRFVVLKGGLARLERALGQFMLDLHTGEHGYEEVQPPILVRDEALFGTAQLPKFHDDQFAAYAEPELRANLEADLRTDRELILRLYNEGGLEKARSALPVRALQLAEDPNRFWLIPTAEVPLTNLVREAILAEDALPLRYTALTPCFRSEAGSAGRDTRGMLRQHQFNKVELVSITTPEQSRDEHERMTACAEEVLKRLGLAYRTVLLSTGDMGFASQKTYDLEVWLPGQKAYREISSCSVCGDFQARRMDARYRAADHKQPRFVHTLNGSGVAVGRALIAVMETYQNEDGSISVPDALRPYMGGAERVGG